MTENIPLCFISNCPLLIPIAYLKVRYECKILLVRHNAVKFKNMNISQVDLQMQYTSGASICICASTSQLLN